MLVGSLSGPLTASCQDVGRIVVFYTSVVKMLVGLLSSILLVVKMLVGLLSVLLYSWL